MKNLDSYNIKLQVGSIILVKRDEICPADIVLLDTSLTKNRENICFVDVSHVNGSNTLETKKACSLTRCNSDGKLGSFMLSFHNIIYYIVERNTNGIQDFSRYRKRLTGKLDYEAPSTDLNTFEGYLKLTKDPKVEQLTIHNLVLRGSVIRNTDW